MNANVGFIEKLRWRLKTFEYKVSQYRHTTNETEVADTEYGKIRGIKRTTIYDEPYYCFEGIPYAQPPLGELRFKAPQRPTPWTDIKDCTNTKNKPVQINFVYNKIEGSEDCLYLNVYTNNLSPEKPRPVMVWIHGGGFQMGEAHRDYYGPDYFMKKDVVLITIQYRLGVFGFLSLSAINLNVPGNAGLKDQVLALKWVKNNCARFGGDPDCITVFGQSAGGASTHFMAITEQAQGLFHRAILMSGNATCCWAVDDRRRHAYTLAKLAGYTGENNEKDILQFLLNAKAKDLKRLEEKVLSSEDRQHRVMFAFAPTIEPYRSADCVIPNDPKDMIKTAWGNSIPIMLGCTSQEGLLWLPETKAFPNVIKDLETCVDFVPRELADPERSSDDTKEKGLILKKAHVTAESPTAENYFDVCAHKYFWFPLHRIVQSYFAHAAATPVFLYRFDFDADEIINPYRIMRDGRGVKGVSHADELTYLFFNMLHHRLPKDSSSYRTIEQTVGIWTQFAATGNPNNKDIPGMEAVTWEPLKIGEEVYKCLNISDELKMIDLPEMEKMKIWESLYDKQKELFY
ncbi:esterase B1-like [Teleopsis dalmanni]|uniref:esterase B1-like n=1 Tax=Teleopsis dalmanni TaxID=139649 RepID=UPI000D32AEAB|nr:esterase B1-like [Teleopsis dalmanni]XP_037947550.1 esterase B1-like [Teleopsis dalmanni]